MKNLIVLKIGSSTLTRGTKQISRGKIEDLARQIIELREQSYEVVLVSSGAIATARQFVKLSNGDSIVENQALAAIGQPVLMRIYQEVFSDFGLRAAQCLLTYHDFQYDETKINTVNTVRVLLDNGYVPIINENDTVATDEINLGDNDKLAAYASVLLGASLLILASDIDGLYDGDPSEKEDARLIQVVEEAKQYHYLAAGAGAGAGQGRGGIKSKLEAGEICQRNGIEMWIVNGNQDNFAQKALNGEILFTRFPSKIW